MNPLLYRSLRWLIFVVSSSIYPHNYTVIAEEQKAMQMQMGMPGGNQMGFDCSKAYAAARDSLDMTRHTWALEDVEKRLLGDRYPTTKSATEAFLSDTGSGSQSAGAAAAGGTGGDGLRKRPVKGSGRG